MLLGPILPISDAVYGSNEVTPAKHAPWYSVSASAATNVGSATSTMTAMVLAQVRAPSGLRIAFQSYLESAVCSPGSAGGAVNAPGVRYGPRPDAVFAATLSNYTKLAVERLRATNSSLLASLVLGGECLPCASGSFTAKYAAASCMLCPPGTAQQASGATSCMTCAAGTYQMTPGASMCGACASSTPSTVGAGAALSSSCYSAVVGIESAWVVGQSIALSVFWSLFPSEDAGATDIAAVFKSSSPALASSRRQLAWTYTSVLSVVSDYPGGGDPGPAPVPRGNIVLTIPSAGAGLYAVYLFRNSSGPYIPGLVPPGGAVLASALYYVAGTNDRIPPNIPASASILQLGAWVGNIPSDLGAQVGSGGLVCPAGTVTAYPSNLLDGGG